MLFFHLSPLHRSKMAESLEEKAHWQSVIKAFDGYMQYHVGQLVAAHKPKADFPV
jgi:hypothetical protein